jgi:ricin-type beta-trefoil lectin protein/glycosyl hydrolase family 95
VSALYRQLIAAAALLLVPPMAIMAAPAGPAAAASLTTAWHSGAFSLNPAGVVSRSDVVLGRPNSSPSQFLPLGNGSLGVSAWAAGGFTAQLNRSDTMPLRLSPGQLQIPGLAAMTSASNFTGTLDLYNGVLDESGGGMTMQAWVPAGKDELIVNVTGASPGTRQTATLGLWSGRSPAAAASGAIGSLAQTWADNSQTGASGQTFGAMAAITAGGQNVTASVLNSTQVQVSFTPNADGSFRVVVASPAWTGGSAASTASSLIGGDTTAATSSLLATQSAAWNAYWASSGLIEMSSSDGTAQYMENLRTLYLYDEAGLMNSGRYPGSQAGLADLYAFDKDQQDWYPAGYWLWNLRGEISANLSSGNFARNLPIFDMYLADLPTIESWTKAQMNGKPGACVPETMRFNGNGYYNGGGITADASCATASNPDFNAETVTSGAEIALWIWQQYQDTGDLSLLRKYYPVMEQAATFLLAWQSAGSDGYLHAVANAHETQWSVPDPTTDMAADQALFPATISAATLLGTDSALASQLRTALGQIEPYPRTDQNTHSQLLNAQPTSAAAAANADAQGTDVIADSYQPSAANHNVENVGLEPVWPYGVIGDNTVVNGDNLTALAGRTYSHRQYANQPDWTYDSIDAARLDMSSQVASDLVASTEKYQIYISGLAAWNPSSPDEPYIEQTANVAMTLDESLATDYDGTLRFAPAWPSGWDASGTVYVQGGSKVDVQVEGGTLATAAIQAGTTATMTVRNPWPGQQAEVVSGSTGAVVIAPTTSATLSVPVTAGQSYLVEQPSSPTTSLPFAQVTGTQATAAKHLGGVQIGMAGGTGGGATGPITAAVSSSKCVDDNNGSGANGTRVQIWDCDGSAPAQNWTVNTNGTITIDGGCLDITGANTANGTLIELWTCNGGANQQWTATSGQLINPASGKCLDDPGSSTANGTQLELWTCNGGANQQWHLP